MMASVEGVVVSVSVGRSAVGEDGLSVMGHSVMLRMGCFTDPADDGVESVVVVSGVLDLADGAVGLVEAVGSLDHVSVSRFPLVLHVAGVLVVDSIFVVVVRVCLKERCGSE